MNTKITRCNIKAVRACLLVMLTVFNLSAYAVSKDSSCNCASLAPGIFKGYALNYKKMTWNDSVKMMKYAKQHKLWRYDKMDISNLKRSDFQPSYHNYWPSINNKMPYANLLDSLLKLDNKQQVFHGKFTVNQVASLLEKPLIIVGKVVCVNDNIGTDTPSQHNTLIKIQVVEIINMHGIKLKVKDYIGGVQESGYYHKEGGATGYRHFPHEQNYEIGKTYLFTLDRVRYDYTLAKHFNTYTGRTYDKNCDSYAAIPYEKFNYDYSKHYDAIKKLFAYIQSVAGK